MSNENITDQHATEGCDAVNGYPLAGSRWNIMSKRHPNKVHCKAHVSEWTPTFTCTKRVVWVCYYAFKDGQKQGVACRSSIHEWRDRVRAGMIQFNKDNAKADRP